MHNKLKISLSAIFIIISFNALSDNTLPLERVFAIAKYKNNKYCLDIDKNKNVTKIQNSYCDDFKQAYFKNPELLCIKTQKSKTCNEIIVDKKYGEVFWGNAIGLQIFKSAKKLNKHIENYYSNQMSSYEKAEKYYWKEKNKKQALKWYLKAAEKNNTRAQSMAGWLLMYEDGVEAAKWFKKAAISGNLAAQNNLGYMYDQGLAEDSFGNSTKAYKWYLMAAKQGDDVAQYNVCISLAYGKGVTKNKRKALKWCEKSAKQGYTNALRPLERLKKELRF